MTAAIFLGVLINIFFETIEQLCFRCAGRIRAERVKWAVAGIGFHIIGFCVWYWLLKHLPLGVAIPLNGASYVTIALACRVLFKEEVTLLRWIGIAVIILGFIVISLDGGWSS